MKRTVVLFLAVFSLSCKLQTVYADASNAFKTNQKYSMKMMLARELKRERCLKKLSIEEHAASILKPRVSLTYKMSRPTRIRRTVGF